MASCILWVINLPIKDYVTSERIIPATDLRALTPLIWEHVHPYGRFELDMSTRLLLT